MSLMILKTHKKNSFHGQKLNTVPYLKLSSQRREESKQLHGESNSGKYMPRRRKAGRQTYRSEDGGVQ